MTTRDDVLPDDPRDDSEPETPPPVEPPAPDPYAGSAPALSFARPTWANAWMWGSWALGLWLGPTYAGSATGWLGFALLLSSGVLALVIYSRARVPATVRRMVVRLPVLRVVEVQRIGALVGVADMTCARCESFDNAAGQRMLDANPQFRLATTHLTPSQMQKTKGAWDAKEGFDDDGQPRNTSDLQWSQMGVCRKQNKGVFAPTSCPRWS